MLSLRARTGSVYFLRKNIRANAATALITPLQAAVAPRRQGPFLIRTFAGDNSGLSTLRPPSNADPALKNSQEVQSIGGDKLGGMIQNNTRIHFKIDVEGFEKEVLEALAEGDIFARVDSVFLEVDEAWVKPTEIIGFLAQKDLASLVTRNGREPRPAAPSWSRTHPPDEGPSAPGYPRLTR